MLPQKKNPDVAELARGKAGRLIGHLAGMLATLKGLPLAYNRDLQEDKEPLFDAFDQLRAGLPAVTGMLATAPSTPMPCGLAADGPAAAAVDLAEWLVERGMPFRQAHAVVGSLVRDSLQRGVPLAELVQAHPALGAEALGLLEPGVAVIASDDARRRRSPSGGGADGALRVRLGLDRERVTHAQAAAHLGDPAVGAMLRSGSPVPPATGARRRARRVGSDVVASLGPSF